ncbi:hypothetical protein AMS68_006404 [Peltaster fructicola]|uniref:Uncharacterized protein n=1 Tax=Peltaster fructicola TaxID=286661 RepID=A0A6H0Y1M8_9PEZI|nr:hypothetical protein AMS68_006404 [Peltaster fructicola]
MLSFLTAACILAPVVGLPITFITSSCPTEQPITILEYNQETQYIKFHLPYSTVDASADEFLAIELEAPQCRRFGTEECLDVVVNGRAVHFQPDSLSSTQVTASTTTSVNVLDSYGQNRLLELRATLSASTDIDSDINTNFQPSQQRVQFHVQSVDGNTVQAGYFSAHWGRDFSGARLDYLDVMRPDKSGLVDLSCLRSPAQTGSFIDLDEDRDDAAEEEYIVSESEALYLLEQQASELQREIKLRKEAVSQRIVDYRSRKPLKELIEQCDGVICAAGQIATRLCDNIHLATSTRSGYTQLQKPLQSSDLSDDEPPSYEQAQMNDPAGRNRTSTGRKYIEDLDSSNGYLLKALAYIASILGLTAIIAFIRRKCMSMRRRVERAADLEERRNARAYRKAARRAEMRRRWDALVKAFTFSKAKQAPRMTDYDEKRALILQDALLEQDFSQLEKGDLMEAEIRQLRNAHDIVSGIIQCRKVTVVPVNDPPPPLVPLPSTPTARSRSSTSTLPSYSSEDPPDYSSIPDPTGENTTTDGFAYYRPASMEYSSHYVAHAPASSSSSQPTRSTPISSVAALSPRHWFLHVEPYMYYSVRAWCLG